MMKFPLGRAASLRFAAVLLAGFAATSAEAAEATASATGTQVTPIAISKTTDLGFGRFTNNDAIGAVVMSPTGARSVTGGAKLVATDAGSAAAFNVTGDNNATYAITLPSSISVTGADGTTTLTVDSFVSTPSATGTLSGAGAQTVSVGATMNLTAATADQRYSGSFPVIVEYN
jgi:hypothetical protein